MAATSGVSIGIKNRGESLLIEKAELSEKIHATRSVQGLNLDQPNPWAKQNSQFGYNVAAKHQLSFIPSQSERIVDQIRMNNGGEPQSSPAMLPVNAGWSITRVKLWRTVISLVRSRRTFGKSPRMATPTVFTTGYKYLHGAFSCMQSKKVKLYSGLSENENKDHWCRLENIMWYYENR